MDRQVACRLQFWEGGPPCPRIRIKVEAVRPIIEGQKSLTQVALELGIKRSVLQRWRDEYQDDTQQAFPGSGQLKPEDAENAQLRRDLKNAQMERDILKKAIAIFSKGKQ